MLEVSKFMKKLKEEGREIYFQRFKTHQQQRKWLKYWWNTHFLNEKTPKLLSDKRQDEQSEKYIGWESRIYKENYMWMCKMKATQYKWALVWTGNSPKGISNAQ